MTSNSNGETATGPADYLSSRPRIRICDLQEAKRRGEKWAMLTSYDAISAKIFDAAMLPCILVGDSAAQAVFGHKSTLPITMDEMIPLVRAVAASCERALVIADLPFGSYQESPQVALKNAIRFMKESLAHGIKLEGGAHYEEHVKLLTKSGIPVMAHVGFTPQQEHTLSGYKIQGRQQGTQDIILSDALKLQAAGAFSCVVEMVPSELGDRLAKNLTIPVIGIGAGPHTDAQILVWTDMCGFVAPKGKVGGYLSGGDTSAPKNSTTSDALQLNRVPKFVKPYANLSETIYKAVLSYAEDVRKGNYPAREHCYE